jgi:uncharacterized protein (DUF2252 family)
VTTVTRIARSEASRATTRAARYRAGKALRQKCPRSANAAFTPAKDRPDVVSLLEESGRERVQDLLPVRYGRMALSPFHFLRGAAMVMAFDLSRTVSSGLRVQMPGDSHVNNFGLFATPERDQVFDANDFDETHPGPWEYDLKRLCTSLVLASRMRGFPRSVARKAVASASRSYREQMHNLAAMRYLDTWYVHLDLEDLNHLLERKGRRLLQMEVGKARRHTGFNAFPRLTEVVRGEVRIRDNPPLIDHYPDPSHAAAYRTIFEEYRANMPAERRILLDRYHLVDVAQKVVGVGSVGTRCSVGLFLADSDVLDPLFLQIKEAVTSVYEPYLGPLIFRNHAERVVVGQRSVQHASDIFLGWSQAAGKDFYVRQLRDMKFSYDITALGPKALLGQAELCGAALARAHARTGDPAAIAGYLGEGDQMDAALLRFAELYARQSEVDHATLQRAIAKGRLPATKVE